MRPAERACPLGPNEVVVAEDVITPAEQVSLLQWVERQHNAGRLVENPADRGAWSSSFQSIDGGLTALTRGEPTAQRPIWLPDVSRADRMPDEFWAIRRRVSAQLALDGFDEDPYKGSFLSWIGPGSGVHQHCDARLEVAGEEHLLLRCNVFLRRPALGGLPVIESREVDVADRGMWAFYPSELVHAATLVDGGEHRGLLSFGYLVHPADVWARRYKLTPSFAAEYGVDGSPEAARGLLAALAAAPEATAIDAVRREVFGFVLSAGEISVAAAATELGRAPEELWPVLRDLYRTAVIQPTSPVGPGCRTIVV
jgi:hypothetical protein